MPDRWETLKRTVVEEATTLDRCIDKWLQERSTEGKRIFCAPGCSNCCTLFVQTTLPEALLVAEKLSVDQFLKLEDYVLRQQKSLSAEHDFLTILRKQRYEIGPCPFLDDTGCCSIYALRPLACRALLSTKPADWCNVDFSTLDPLDKRLYLDSLERSVVAFPTHYVAGTQDAAQEGEKRILEQMAHLFGEAIIGNFPLLVYLSFSTNLVAQISEGSTMQLTPLTENPFFHPQLIKIDIQNRGR